MKTGLGWSMALLLAVALAPTNARTAEKQAKAASAKMDHYLVIAPHQPEDCVDVLDDLNMKNRELLKKIEWGCTDGDHTGYLLVDASSKDAAIKKLPEKEQSKAKAIKMAKFTPQQIKAIHEKMDKK